MANPIHVDVPTPILTAQLLAAPVPDTHVLMGVAVSEAMGIALAMMRAPWNEGYGDAGTCNKPEHQEALSKAFMEFLSEDTVVPPLAWRVGALLTAARALTCSSVIDGLSDQEREAISANKALRVDRLAHTIVARARQQCVGMVVAFEAATAADPIPPNAPRRARP